MDYVKIACVPDDWNRRCSCSVRLNFTYIYNPNWMKKEKEELAEEEKEGEESWQAQY